MCRIRGKGPRECISGHGCLHGDGLPYVRDEKMGEKKTEYPCIFFILVFKRKNYRVYRAFVYAHAVQYKRSHRMEYNVRILCLLARSFRRELEWFVYVARAYRTK